jgi:hypothetical protein
MRIHRRKESLELPFTSSAELRSVYVICHTMPRYLDQDYDQAGKPTGLIPHFWETLEVLGGALGIFGIFLGIALFYTFVNWFITSGRKKREAKKKR